MLKVFNTFTREYVEISVEQNIEQEVKRSYWREDAQNRRYHKRCSAYLDEVDYADSQWSDILYCDMVRKFDAAVVDSVLELLDEKKKFIITKVYFEECTLTSVASTLGVSVAYVSRLHRQALSQLRKTLIEDYNYLG